MKNSSFRRSFALISLLLLTFSTFVSNAQKEEIPTNADRLRQGLSGVHTAADSIKILYDVFDVLPRRERIPVGEEIYKTAGRVHNTGVQLDILRLLSVIFDTDEPLAKIEAELDKLPNSNEREETRLFIKMRRVSLQSRKQSEKERQQEIVNILHSYEDTVKKSNLDQILDIYTLVEYLKNDATGDMLKEYIERLTEMVNSPEILYAVQNNVYSEAASIYSEAQDYDKAVAANLKLLKVIDNLEKSYHDNGRLYRNYDVSRYVVYRRMLRNAQALKPGEAEKYYRMAMELAEKNSDVRQEVENNPRIHAYYYYAIGDYSTAAKYLKDVIRRNSSIASQKQFLEMLIDASAKTGDDKTRLEALTDYTSLLSELNELKAAEKSRELQILFDLQDLKTRNQELEINNQEQEINSERQIMTLLIVAFAILVIALVIMLFNWGRNQKNTIRMGLMADNLHRERYKLRDSLYTDYPLETDPLSEEDKYRDLTWRKRMRKAGQNRGNATIFMTEGIINDMLFIATTAHADMIKNITKISASQLMSQTEAKAISEKGDGSMVKIAYPARDFDIKTDKECFISLMIHIFDVAAKYFPGCPISLSCDEPRDGHVNFAITVERGIAASDEDPQIFLDMELSKILLHDEKSGLFLCRMISMLLKCKLIADMNYTEGTRYLLRMPVDMEN